MNNNRPGNQPTRNQQREKAREKARELRNKQKRKQSRNRWLIQGGIAVAILGIAAIVIVSLVNANNNNTAGNVPANMASDGFLVKGVNGKLTPVT